MELTKQIPFFSWLQVSTSNMINTVAFAKKKKNTVATS